MLSVHMGIFSPVDWDGIQEKKFFFFFSFMGKSDYPGHQVLDNWCHPGSYIDTFSLSTKTVEVSVLGNQAGPVDQAHMKRTLKQAPGKKKTKDS